MNPVGAAEATPTRVDLEARSSGPDLVSCFGVAALIGLAPASIIYLSFSQGGFFPSATGFAAVGFAGALVLRTTMAEHPFDGYNRRLTVVLLALSAFAGLQLASALWSHDTARALDEYDRTLLYLLALAFFGSLPASTLRLRWLIRALAAGVTAVCLIALVSRVLPHVWPTARDPFPSRLSYPLSYWNALGLLAALATILLVHLASSEREHPAVRVLGAVFIPATVATVLLTFSRGGLAVGALGIVAYVLLARPRGLLGAAVAAIPTGAVALHTAYSADLLASSNPLSPAAIAQGRHVAITVGSCMLAAGVVRAVFLFSDSWFDRILESPRRRRVPPRVAAISVAIVALVGVLALVGSGFVTREYHQFAGSTGSSGVQTRDRLTSVYGEHRVELWKIGLHAFRDRPLLGYGAGTYEFYYARHRQTTGSVVHAHSLYAQTLGELGIVGFAALMLALLGILVLLATRIRGPDRAVYAVLFAAGLAWALHAGEDWDWEMPAVTLWLFIVGGAALASRRRGATQGIRREFRNRNPIAVAWLVLAIAPLLIGGSYLRLRASGTALAAGNCVQARQSALSSMSLLAVRPEAYSIISVCDLQLGFPAEALQAAQKAVHYEQNNWNFRYGLAIALAANGLDPRLTAEQALRMNPQELIVQDEVGAFSTRSQRAWEQAAPGVLSEGLDSGLLAISTL